MASTTEPKLISFNELIGKHAPSHGEQVQIDCDKLIPKINESLTQCRYAGFDKLELCNYEGLNPRNRDLVLELDKRLCEAGYRTYLASNLDFKAQNWVCESFQVMLSETAKPTLAHRLY